MLAVNMNPKTFSFGAQTPPLAGDYVFGRGRFVVYGKEKVKGGGKVQAPIVYAELPVTGLEASDTHNLRYSVGLSSALLPGIDADNYAQGDGNDGPSGEFLLAVNPEKLGERWGQPQFNTFPLFWASLDEAGVPEDLLASVQTKGIGVLEGIQVTFQHKIEKYIDKDTGKEMERSPFNYAVAGSAKMPGQGAGKAKPKGAKAAAAPKPAAPAAPAAPTAPAPVAQTNQTAANGAVSADDASNAVLDQTLQAIAEKLTGGEAIARDEAARIAAQLATDAGLPAVQGLYIHQGVKGTGRFAAGFAERLAGAGISMGSDGAYSI